MFYDKTDKTPRDRSDRICHRRQGRNRLGNRRRSWTPQSAAQGRLHGRNADCAIPAARLLTFYLSQKHGGWNSDDNQNHNLGTLPPLDHHHARRRRRSAAQNTFGTFWPFQRTNARLRRCKPSSVTGARRFRNGRQRTQRSRSCGGSIRKALRNWCCRRARVRVRPTSDPRRLPEAGKPVSPGVPAFLHPLPAECAARRA